MATPECSESDLEQVLAAVLDRHDLTFSIIGRSVLGACKCRFSRKVGLKNHGIHHAVAIILKEHAYDMILSETRK